ncbi:hypothetical protein ACFFKE_11480 [Streptomyces mutabilis]|uniref:hypothetical protein n=1 Tax=Streptomyces mutabilis TaxID=67332 RepID=UPI00177D035C|nr:hypothetical protein [Streptomyces mutabilis]GGQ50116.1 hypothetical protein GCM10010279_69280 [Streptomyces mutabilis]
MIAALYLASVLGAAVVLAVALRRRPTPAPPEAPAPTPAPALAVDGGAEIRVILAATHQLAARLSTAA